MSLKSSNHIRWLSNRGFSNPHGETVFVPEEHTLMMGERACYREYCPHCDGSVTIVDETCPDCGRPLEIQ